MSATADVSKAVATWGYNELPWNTTERCTQLSNDGAKQPCYAPALYWLQRLPTDNDSQSAKIHYQCWWHMERYRHEARLVAAPQKHNRSFVV